MLLGCRRSLWVRGGAGGGGYKQTQMYFGNLTTEKKLLTA
jgi:hypothetical protein